MSRCRSRLGSFAAGGHPVGAAHPRRWVQPTTYQQVATSCSKLQHTRGCVDRQHCAASHAAPNLPLSSWDSPQVVCCGTAASSHATLPPSPHLSRHGRGLPRGGRGPRGHFWRQAVPWRLLRVRALPCNFDKPANAHAVVGGCALSQPFAPSATGFLRAASPQQGRENALSLFACAHHPTLLPCIVAAPWAWATTPTPWPS